MGRNFSTKMMFLIFIAVFIPPSIQSCSPQRDPASTGSIPTAVHVTAADASDCPNGGVVYSVFQDTNSNGVLEAQESVVNSQTVCNGSNGHSSLISTNRISTDLMACAANSGLQINTGLDLNDNATLEPSEIISTQVICDGQNGTVGSAGPPGSDGHSMAFHVTPAPHEICSTGGSIILMALDDTNSGVYDPLSSRQQSLTICNGQNAPVSIYQPVEPIMPCGNSVAYKEVLLRLANGQVLASFSDNANGLNTRLTLVPDGNYLDTDNSNCAFSLSTSADKGTRSISWLGQVQMTWPLMH